MRQVTFSVSREDLAFDFAHAFDDVFSFLAFTSEEPTPNDGPIHSEPLGYDFQQECSQ